MTVPQPALGMAGQALAKQPRPMTEADQAVHEVEALTEARVNELRHQIEHHDQLADGYERAANAHRQLAASAREALGVYQPMDSPARAYVAH